MQPLTINLFSATDKGLEREHNEDYHSYCADLSAQKAEWSFFALEKGVSPGQMGTILLLADGMGGTNAGEVASKMIIEALQGYFSEIRTLPGSSEIRSTMEEAIHKANRIIIDFQRSNPATRGMGTTLVVGWIINNKLYLSWVGDSRAYCLSKTNGLFAISKDHSLVQELVDKGEITYEQAFFHPQSNIITQSLGDEKRKPSPGFTEYNLQIGDRILLCSDGLNGMIQDKDIEIITGQIADIETCGRELISTANKAGGHDNITVVLCDIVTVEALAPSFQGWQSMNPAEDPATQPTRHKRLSSKTLTFLIVAALLAGIAIGAVAIWHFRKPAIISDETELLENEGDSLKVVPEVTNGGVRETQNHQPADRSSTQGASTPPAADPSTDESDDAPKNGGKASRITPNSSSESKLTTIPDSVDSNSQEDLNPQGDTNPEPASDGNATEETPTPKNEGETSETPGNNP